MALTVGAINGPSGKKRRPPTDDNPETSSPKRMTSDRTSREHEDDLDALSVYRKLINHYLTSTQPKTFASDLNQNDQDEQSMHHEDTTDKGTTDESFEQNGSEGDDDSNDGREDHPNKDTDSTDTRPTDAERNAFNNILDDVLQRGTGTPLKDALIQGGICTVPDLFMMYDTKVWELTYVDETQGIQSRNRITIGIGDHIPTEDVELVYEFQKYAADTTGNHATLSYLGRTKPTLSGKGDENWGALTAEGLTAFRCRLSVEHLHEAMERVQGVIPLPTAGSTVRRVVSHSNFWLAGPRKKYIVIVILEMNAGGRTIETLAMAARMEPHMCVEYGTYHSLMGLPGWSRITTSKGIKGLRVSDGIGRYEACPGPYFLMDDEERM